MSVEIVLIPLALAAVGAWKARAQADTAGVCVVQTRLRDPDLLSDALRALGAQVALTPGVVTGRLGATELSFSARIDGSVVAHVTAADPEEAERLVLAVDDAYAAAVQVALYQRLIERAPGLGLRVADQSVDEEDGITLVLETERT